MPGMGEYKGNSLFAGHREAPGNIIPNIRYRGSWSHPVDYQLNDAVNLTVTASGTLGTTIPSQPGIYVCIVNHTSTSTFNSAYWTPATGGPWQAIGALNKFSADAVQQYGADPTETNDSSTAINNAIVAVNAAGGGTVTLTAGTFLAANPINLLSNVKLVGAGRQATKIAAASGLTTRLIYGNGVQYCGVENLNLDCVGQSVTDAITLAPLSNHITFTQVDVGTSGAGSFVTGLNCGTNNTQVSEIGLIECDFAGAWTSGNNSTWQNGITFGNGTTGNVLDLQHWGCSFSAWANGNKIQASSFRAYAGDSENNQIDFYLPNPLAADSVIDGWRSEGATRFLYGPNSDSLPLTTMTCFGIYFDVSKLNSDGHWIYYNMPGLSVIGAAATTVPPGGVTVSIYTNQNSGSEFGSALFVNVMMPTVFASAFPGGAAPIVINYQDTTTPATTIMALPDIEVTGLTGATTSMRLAGGHSGPPTSGTFLQNDVVTDPTGTEWICVTGGSPGTWAPAMAPGSRLSLWQNFR